MIAPIDVVLCTWNSNRYCFRRCLQSMIQHVPVHHLIVVDRYSTDGTIHEIKRNFPEAKVAYSSDNLGLARKIGVSLVDSEFFAFIDDDVEIPADWFPLLERNLAEDVGAIHSTVYAVDQPPVIAKWDAWLLQWEQKWNPAAKKEIIDVTQRNRNAIRGYTHNTIVRTELLADWSPPGGLSSYEDWHLLKHITAKGYVWRILPDEIVKHYRPHDMSEQWGRTKWNLVGARISGFPSPALTWYLGQMLIRGLEATLASFQLKDPRVLLYVVQRHLAYIDGYLRWNRYRVYTRV